MTVLTAIIAMLVLSVPAAAKPPSTLLEFAASVTVDSLPDESVAPLLLRSRQRALAAANPPNEHCNLALGARRYADLYQSLAAANERLGDYHTASANALRAVNCAPREVSYLASYAGQLLMLRDYALARQVIERGASIAPQNYDLRLMQLRLNFAEARWDAVVDITNSLLGDDADETRWMYWTLLRWSAQRRSGHSPELRLPRKLTEDWPAPVWLLLTHQLNQAQLVQQLAAVDNQKELRRRLCEAMFYFGESLLADADKVAAQQHFAQASRMKILDYVEHDLALAELARLRADASGSGLTRTAHHIFVAR